MSNLLELIARLNPKSPNFLVTGGGGGGNGSLTNEDIAGALAGVTHPLGSMLLRTMIAGQDPSEMYSAWAIYTRAIAKKEGWRAKQESAFTRLAYATLDEYMDCRCTTCVGRGIVRKRVGVKTVLPDNPVYEGGYLVVQCPDCIGSGKGAKNASVRGRLLGMKHSSYVETWETRYEFLLGELANIQRNSEDEFKRQFKRR